MNRTLALLVVAAVTVAALPAAAEEPSSPSPSPAVEPQAGDLAPPGTGGGRGTTVAPSGDHGLAQVHGGVTADGSRAAGRPRDVELGVRAGSEPKVVRPAPTPRALRRMNVGPATAALDGSVRACAAESVETAPTALELRVVIGPAGEVESAAPSRPVKLSAGSLACVTSKVLALRFGAPGPQGATIVLPVTAPARSAATPAR